MKIGVYLELERRGRSIPGGGKLSSELEANTAAVVAVEAGGSGAAAQTNKPTETNKQ